MIKIKKDNIKENINILLKGIYAGIMIGIGGSIYLSVANRVVGAILCNRASYNMCLQNELVYRNDRLYTRK